MKDEDEPLLGKDNVVTMHYSSTHSLEDSRTESNIEVCDMNVAESVEVGERPLVTLTWRDIHVYTEQYHHPGLFKNGEYGKYTCKDILKRVSGLVEPGHTLGIIGPVKSGKTVLLQTLAHRKIKDLKVTGTVHVNGWPVEASQMANFSGYIESTDKLEGTLTVKETLVFYASLRLDRRYSSSRKVQQINTTMRLVDLAKVQRNLVSDISKEEYMRLLIGCELICGPSLLFVDEPIRNLSNTEAFEIVKLLNDLAAHGRTVIFTLSHPPSNVYAALDQTCIMGDGHIVYLGTNDKALEEFETRCPAHYNPADHFIKELDITVNTKDDLSTKIQEMTSRYKYSSDFHAMEEKINEVARVNAIKPGFINCYSLPPKCIKKYGEMMKRAIIKAKRNPCNTKKWLGPTLFWGIFLGLSFFLISNSSDAAINKSGILFVYLLVFTYTFSYGLFGIIPKDLAHTSREITRIKMYSVLAYLNGILIMFITYLFLIPLLVLIIGYFMTGLSRDVGSFFTAYFVAVGTCWVSGCLGLFLSSCARLYEFGYAVVVFVTTPFVIFGGIFQTEEITPYWFYPVRYTSWIRYSWHSLMINEFSGKLLQCSSAEKKCLFSTGDEVLDLYGIQTGSLWWPNIIVNVILGFVCLILTWVVLRRQLQR